MIGQTDAEADTAVSTLCPADDDLALRAALYGLVIQSYADKVSDIIFTSILQILELKLCIYHVFCALFLCCLFAFILFCCYQVKFG